MKRVRVTSKVQPTSKLMRAAAARGLATGLEHVLTESRKQVPIEEGTLEHSGVATVDEANLRGAVSYDTPYAVRQHEDLTLRHAEGRKAKYLEDPLLEEGPTVMLLVRAEMRRALR